MSRCTILAYHVIDDARADVEAPYCCPPALLRSHLEHLRDGGYSVLSLADLLSALDGGTPLPPRSVVITFDDGTSCMHEAAAPIVSEFGYPASLFMVSGLLGGEDEWNVGRSPRRRMLDARQLRELAEAGIDIGSHTAHHVALAGAPPARRRRELVDSKAQLEDLLGREVPHFAYPYGSFDRAARDAVEAAGYRAGCSREPGRNHRTVDPFLLRRIGIGGRDHPAAFRWKVRFGLEDVEVNPLARAFAKRALSRVGLLR